MTNFSAHQNSYISKPTSSINQTHIYISSTYSSYTIHPSSKNPQTHKQLIQTPDLGITSPSAEHFRAFPFPFPKRPHTPYRERFNHDIQKLVTQRVRSTPKISTTTIDIFRSVQSFRWDRGGISLGGCWHREVFSAGCRWKRERGER